MSLYDENLPIPNRKPIPSSLLPKISLNLGQNPNRPKLAIKHSRSNSQIQNSVTGRSIKARSIGGLSGSTFQVRQDELGEFGVGQGQGCNIEDISFSARDGKYVETVDGEGMVGRMKELEKIVKGLERATGAVKGSIKTWSSRGTS
jgi:hypothetical protein